MIAHMVINYDIKFEDGKGYPPHMYIGSGCAPANAILLFRKRDV
jgi:hypothetical protein